MKDFKGLFYKKDKEKLFYEGGAHFKYSDLVKELNKLLKEPNNIVTTSNLINSNSQKQGLVSIKNNILKTEENNNYLLYKEKPLKSKLLTLDNYKNIVINKNNISTKQRSYNKDILNKINVIKSSHKYKLSPIKNSLSKKNLLDKNSQSKSLKKLKDKDINKTNNNLRFILNYKSTIENNLPLINSSHSKKILEKNDINTINSNKNFLKYISKLDEVKSNYLLNNHLFFFLKNIDKKRNNIFPFKSPDGYRNKNDFDTIDNLSKRSNYNFGKLEKYFSNKKYIQKK